jgi:hypothetical protein
MNGQPELPNLVRGGLTFPSGLRRGLLIVFMLLVVPIIGSLLAINRFCLSGLYFLSEQAAIDAWVDHVISLRTVPVPLPHGGYVKNVIPYRDRADFYRRNPAVAIPMQAARRCPSLAPANGSV